MTYKEAMAYPAKSRIGWAHIDKDSDSMQAFTADCLGRQCCIRPEAIYNWAKTHGVSLRDKAKLFRDTADLLLICVLNNWTLDNALNQLQKATT